MKYEYCKWYYIPETIGTWAKYVYYTPIQWGFTSYYCGFEYINQPPRMQCKIKIQAVNSLDYLEKERFLLVDNSKIIQTLWKLVEKTQAIKKLFKTY